MTLLPFDIETAKLAMIAGTGQLVTREGRGVILTNLEGEDPDFPIEGEILARGSEILYKWTREGKISPKGLLPREDDLMIFTSFDL